MSTLRRPNRSWLWVFLASLGLILTMRALTHYGNQWNRRLTYSEFYRIVESNLVTHQLAEARLIENRVEGRLADNTRFYVNVTMPDEDLMRLLRNNVPTFDIQPQQAGMMAVLMALSPWIILLGLMWLFMRSAQGGGRLLAFGKSRARLISPETHTRVTFDDVAGIDEAKEEQIGRAHV